MLISASTHFYPRPPGGGRPTIVFGTKTCFHFYPRPPGGGRRCTINANCPGEDISIHALRVEGDGLPHTLRHKFGRFLSTPSGWRATVTNYGIITQRRISIHALRVEGDPLLVADRFFDDPFLSTPSGWRATPGALAMLEAPMISIHALRVEGDKNELSRKVDISPFLSTPSGWRATMFFLGIKISASYFYPRPPGGGRRPPMRALQGLLYFYPRPPGGGRRLVNILVV